jgi:maleylacetate reductase
VPLSGTWTEVPSDRIEVGPGSDAILAFGGGSAIDTAKAASAATGLPVLSVPTTYSGAEWATSFGVRRPDRTMAGGGGGARLEGIVYDVDLTLGGASSIAAYLPEVVDSPRERFPRDRLLRGAADAGHALGLAGLGLGHAIAQALGGTYGLSHGAMNALALPAAIRFNTPLAPAAVARFGEAIGAPDDPAGKVEELARLGGFGRLRDFGVPEDGLPAVAEAAAGRTGNRRNPRPATAAEIEALLHSIY